jgi:hypothetical protein
VVNARGREGKLRFNSDHVPAKAPPIPFALLSTSTLLCGVKVGSNPPKTTMVFELGS